MTKEQDNLQTVHFAYNAFAQGDLPTVRRFPHCRRGSFSAAFTVVVLWACPWHGRQEVEQYFKTMAAALDFQNFAGDEFIVSHDFVRLGHNLHYLEFGGVISMAVVKGVG